MTDALLFDFNGVIVDDEDLHCEALRAALAAERVPLSREAYYADFLGFDDRMCVIEAFRRVHRTIVGEQVARLMADKARRYESLIGEVLPLVAGIREFVPRAAERFRLAVVSGALRREIELVLERVGLAGRFEVIVAAEDVERCKPDPEGLRLALERLALPAARGVVLEDSLPGLAAARAAGMRCAMLATSHDRDRLRAAGADLVWTSFTGHDPDELGALLERGR